MRSTNKTGPRVPWAPAEGHECPWGGGSRRFSHVWDTSPRRERRKKMGIGRSEDRYIMTWVPHAKGNYFRNLANFKPRMSSYSDVFATIKLSHMVTVQLRSVLVWPRAHTVSRQLPDFGQVHYLPWVSAPPL